MKRLFVCLLTIFCRIAAAGAEPAEVTPSAGEKPDRFDILVIAPHSDDEAIGCAAVILRATAKGERVGIVIVTAGDAFPKAAAAAAGKKIAALTSQDYINLAALRQRHTLEAMPKLGVPASDLFFLGYPDGGLKTIYEATDERPYRQPLTGKSETYGIAVGDYHAGRHGRPAPYRKASIAGDLQEIIAEARPREIYTTSEVDTHADHAAVFQFVRDAAAAAGFRGTLWVYVVHGAAPAEPPALRIALTEAELRRKRATLEIYQAGVSPVHDRLAEEYTRREELFRRISLPEPNRP